MLRCERPWKHYFPSYQSSQMSEDNLQVLRGVEDEVLPCALLCLRPKDQRRRWRKTMEEMEDDGTGTRKRKGRNHGRVRLSSGPCEALRSRRKTPSSPTTDRKPTTLDHKLFLSTAWFCCFVLLVAMARGAKESRPVFEEIEERPYAKGHDHAHRGRASFVVVVSRLASSKKKKRKKSWTTNKKTTRREATTASGTSKNTNGLKENAQEDRDDEGRGKQAQMYH